jgi:phosphatidylglycerophosphate synthase
VTQPKPRAGYQSDDREILLGAFQWLFWRWMLPLIPRFVTPNALTIFGNLCVMASVPAMLAGTLVHHAWFIVSAVLVFIYISADNLDGPHARRTGRASRLGELLDHGLDGLASGSLLLDGVIALHLDPTFSMLLMTFGTLAYVLCMWEQYRTNVLVIPAVSGTEGAALVMGLAVVDFAFGNPAWMHFDTSELSVSTGIMIFVVISYAAALIPPIVRSRRAGAELGELLLPSLLLIALAFFPALGADPLVAGALVAVVGSDFGVRLIRLRQSEQEASLVMPSRWLLLAPLAVALVVRQPEVSAACALVSTGLASAMFLAGLVRAARELGALSRSSDA